VVLAIVAFVEHRVAVRARDNLAVARQDAARLRLVEQELYHLKTRQDWMIGLLQPPHQGTQNDSAHRSGLEEAAALELWPVRMDSAAFDPAAENPVPHLWPVSGWVTQEFRPPNSPRHQGIDIAEKLGSPVVAPARGEVLQIYWSDTMGRVLEIQHTEGHLTRYAHLQTVEVEPGDMVEAGQMVARLGTSGKSTAPHLHYEVELRGTPMDPARFLPHYESDAAPATDADAVGGTR
jgi:murein DD-endopeptidase MepM/ murein hydrolase activator NlpD